MFNELEAFIVRYWIPFQLHPMTTSEDDTTATQSLYREGLTTVLCHHQHQLQSMASGGLGDLSLLAAITRNKSADQLQKEQAAFL